jgi:hypothetical protein
MWFLLLWMPCMGAMRSDTKQFLQESFWVFLGRGTLNFQLCETACFWVGTRACLHQSFLRGRKVSILGLATLTHRMLLNFEEVTWGKCDVWGWTRRMTCLLGGLWIYAQSLPGASSHLQLWDGGQLSLCWLL